MSLEPQLRSVRARVPPARQGGLGASRRGDGQTIHGGAEIALEPDRVVRRALDVGRRTALGILAADHATADDVAQEVAIQALRHVDRLRDPAALDAWLHRTAVRAALRARRRTQRRRAVEEEHVVVRGDAPAVDGTLDDLGRLLRGLPDRQRAALTLRYAHDLDDARIAAALGCREGTVRALLSRGRDAVRERLDAPSRLDGEATPAQTRPATTDAGAENA